MGQSGVGLDDDQDCAHDWQLDELVADKPPGGLLPALSRVSRCVLCGAVTYDASRRPNRPALGGGDTT
jgi:hypothetical protein